jgi:hypothetical protein
MTSTNTQDVQALPVTLDDPGLSGLAALVSDLEKVRIAIDNRIRILTATLPDDDGVMRGFALPADHPSVKRLSTSSQKVSDSEKHATTQLRAAMRQHPLWTGFGKDAKGVGEKQLARLLGAIGDPYIRTLPASHSITDTQEGSAGGTLSPTQAIEPSSPERRTPGSEPTSSLPANEGAPPENSPPGAGLIPRTVSQLWAYCGLHTLPADPRSDDTQIPFVGGASPSPQAKADTSPTKSSPGGNQAARRQKGVKANWSTEAKMRAHLIATSCIKHDGPYRDVYDRRRERTAITHPDWTPGHSHNDALRITAKTILKDLWRAARTHHQANSDAPAPEGGPDALHS